MGNSPSQSSDKDKKDHPYSLNKPISKYSSESYKQVWEKSSKEDSSTSSFNSKKDQSYK